jgi:hypothetical protein
MASNPASFTFTGDIKNFEKFIKPGTAQSDLVNAIRKGTIRNYLFLIKKVKDNIRNREFDSNSELTLAMKNSDLPLLNQRNLWNAIDFKMKSAFEVEVGIIKKAGSTGSQFGKAKSQISMETLVELMEEGYDITVTDKMKKAIAIALSKKEGKGSSTKKRSVSSMKTGSTLTVPSRKVFSKVFEEDPTIDRVLQENWRKAIEDMWKKRGAKDGEHRDKK